MSPIQGRACRIYTNDGQVALTGDDLEQTIRFDRTQYAYMPPLTPSFTVQDDAIPEVQPTLRLNARTEISGDILTNVNADFDSIRQQVETQAIQNIQRQYFNLVNPGGTSVTPYAGNYWDWNTITSSAGTCVTNDPWRIATSGTNYIQVPNGIRVIQIVNEPTTGTDYRVTVTAEIDPFTWEAIQKQNKEYAPKKIREHMRSRLLIKIAKKVASRAPLTHEQRVTAQELKARETLRDMISEWEWRRYVTNGFIMVKGKSGIWYQVFANGDRLKTFKDGKAFESLCIHTDRECPPTDHVINMKVLIEIDEEAVRKGSNIRTITASEQRDPEFDALIDSAVKESREKNLVALFKELRPAKTA